MMPFFSRAVLAAVALLLLLPAVAVSAPAPLPAPRGSCTIGPLGPPGPVTGTCTTTCNSTTLSVSTLGAVDLGISGACSGQGAVTSTASCGPAVVTCSGSGANLVFPRTLTCVAWADFLIIAATCSS